jgi:predicted permease
MLAQDELLRRIEALPDVRSAAYVSNLPLGNGGNTVRFVVQGRPLEPGALEPEANIRRVSAGYFTTMGVPVVDGRSFDRRDGPEAERVVIINRTLADRHFPAGAVGQQLRFTFAKDQPPRRIVGVIGDEKLGPLDVAPRPAIYTPYLQAPSTFMGLVARGTVDATTLRRAVASLDPTIAFYDVAFMEERVARAPWMFVRRFPALLVGAFAALALVLTAVGIYGVLSYTVRQRTHELGIRRAIGAPATHIFGLVLGRAAALAVLGLLIGLAGALVAARLLSSLLFGVAPWDPLTLAIVGGGLLIVALIASWLPARTAVRVDPMEALR